VKPPDPNPPSKSPIGTATMSSAMRDIPKYYRWVFERFQAYLGSTVLDVGTGPGIHLPCLHGRRVIAADLSDECLAEAQSRFPWIETVRGDICDSGLTARLAGLGIDTITCLNVLEHIPDDSRALASCRAILEPSGGRLILVVPAHPALYGAMDRLAAHVRRYSLGPLLTLLDRAGFTPLRAEYFNFVGGLGWYANAKLLRAPSLSAPSVNWQVRFFGKVVLPVARLADTVFLRGLRIPFGQSLVVVAAPQRRSRRP
jgi:SAM-dependent methyltransferase